MLPADNELTTCKDEEDHAEYVMTMALAGQDPIGRRLSIQKNGPLFEVVGGDRKISAAFSSTNRPPPPVRLRSCTTSKALSLPAENLGQRTVKVS